MPSTNFQRIDLDLLFPPFREAVLQLIANCLEKGASYHATRGYDTYGAQMALWSKGRVTKGPIVTHAKGGQSAHNFGLAVDFVLDLDPKAKGIQPGWAKECYEILVLEAKRMGLHSGENYNDLPHVAWPGFVTATDLLPLHKSWEASASSGPATLDRLKEVWKNLTHGLQPA